MSSFTHFKTMTVIAWLVLIALTENAQSRTFPGFPSADFMHVKIVSEEMIVNGLPMAAFQFTSKKSPDKVAQFYSEHWGADRMADVVFGDWRVLSHRKDGYLFTVQIENNIDIVTHGTLGITPAFEYLAKGTAKLKANAARMGEGFPSLPGTEILNDISSVDQGRPSRTLMFKNRRSVRSNLDYYQKKMDAQGWQNIAPDVPVKYKSQLQAIAMNRNGQQFNLSFSKVNGETYGVAVYVN